MHNKKSGKYNNRKQNRRCRLYTFHGSLFPSVFYLLHLLRVHRYSGRYGSKNNALGKPGRCGSRQPRRSYFYIVGISQNIFCSASGNSSKGYIFLFRYRGHKNRFIYRRHSKVSQIRSAAHESEQAFRSIIVLSAIHM